MEYIVYLFFVALPSSVQREQATSLPFIIIVPSFDIIDPESSNI